MPPRRVYLSVPLLRRVANELSESLSTLFTSPALSQFFVFIGFGRPARICLISLSSWRRSTWRSSFVTISTAMIVDLVKAKEIFKPIQKGEGGEVHPNEPAPGAS